MVHGYHLILVTYGAWLPNDPRGSWSDYVASWELFKYGPATRSDFHKSLLNEPDLMAKRRAAQQGLKYPPVVLSGQQARSAGVGFGNLIRKSRLTVLACAILPEHVRRAHRWCSG